MALCNTMNILTETDLETLLATAEDLNEENVRLKQQLQKMQETTAKATERKQQAEDKVGNLLTIIENLSNEVCRLRLQIEQNHTLQNGKVPAAIFPSTSPDAYVQANGPQTPHTSTTTSVEPPSSNAEKSSVTKTGTKSPPKSTATPVEPPSSNIEQSSVAKTKSPPKSTTTPVEPPSSTTEKPSVSTTKSSPKKKASVPTAPSAKVHRTSSSTKNPPQRKASVPTAPSGKVHRTSSSTKNPPQKRASAAAIPLSAGGQPNSAKNSESRRRSTPIPLPATKGTTGPTEGIPKVSSGKPSSRNTAKEKNKDGNNTEQVTYYPYAMLKVVEFKDLPPGVDRAQLEVYLSDAEFQEVFKLTKEQYYTKPMWKQSQLKKQAGLF